MRNWLNLVSCLGCLLFLGGGFLVAAGLFGGWSIYVATIGAVVLFVGLALFFSQVKAVEKWNKVVGIAKSQESMAISELSAKSGVPLNKVNNILYEAIASGDLSGTIREDRFVRERPDKSTGAPAPAKVLVVCPYCGAKNEQGVPKCHACGASL